MSGQVGETTGDDLRASGMASAITGSRHGRWRFISAPPPPQLQPMARRLLASTSTDLRMRRPGWVDAAQSRGADQAGWGGIISDAAVDLASWAGDGCRATLITGKPSFTSCSAGLEGLTTLGNRALFWLRVMRL